MTTTDREPALDSLKDLTRIVQKAEGFHGVIAALKNGRAATVDGAWNSSASLVTAAIGLHEPQTLLIVLAHPRDLDRWAEDLFSFSGARAVVFPAWDAWPSRDVVHDEVAGQRLRILKQLESQPPPRFVLTTVQALLQPVPDRAQLAQQRRRLRVGERIDLEEFSGWLVEHRLQRMEAVELPGEFSRRGGILDVFATDAEVPCRIELFGDEIESIRQFSPQTQRSLGDLQAVEITAAQGEGRRAEGEERKKEDLSPSALPLPPFADRGHLCDFLPADAWTVMAEPDELREQGKNFLERVVETTGLFSIPGVFQQLVRFPNVIVSALPSATTETTCHLRVESVERFSGEVGKLRDELDTAAAGDRVLIACHNEAERQRLTEVLAAGQLAQSDRLRLVLGRVHAGFRMVEAAIAVIGDHELFHREEVRSVLPRRQLESRAIDSFLELQEGDLVVHVSHGIARYRGTPTW